MKVVLSTVGRFHMFALARELEKHDCLEQIYSGFPWHVLSRERVSRQRVKTFPLVRPIIMGMRHLPFPTPQLLYELLDLASIASQDRYVRRDIPDCDIFVGHESVGLLSGQAAKAKGAAYVCDRGTTHIGWREELLDEEYDRVGIKRAIHRTLTFRREIEDYDVADMVVVPSHFAKRSFIEKGFADSKLTVVPYGVQLDAFTSADRPSRDIFDVLFVGGLSVRKGANDLFTAFEKLDVPNKRLTLVGSVAPDIRRALKKGLQDPRVRVLGHIPHRELRFAMSRSHVLVLPSVEDGFGLVQAEAMACGCPVVATTNTGAMDLFSDGIEGYIVPVRDPDAIADRLLRLAADPDLRDAMSEAALRRIRLVGGWDNYGKEMISVYRGLQRQRKL